MKIKLLTIITIVSILLASDSVEEKRLISLGFIGGIIPNKSSEITSYTS
jgi:hypothetical protein